MAENRKESKQINFRVNEEEYQRLEEMATKFGMTVPMFCKKKSQGSKMKSPKIDREGAIKMASELRKIGINVNQVAKHLNSGGNVLEGQIKDLERELNNLWQLLNSAIQK